MSKKSTTPDIDPDAIDLDFAWTDDAEVIEDEVIEVVEETEGVVFNGRAPNGKLLRK